jgi:DNA-binding transcriptional LysR family regulator
MDFRHLRYVIAAAEHGSFRRAAAALGICESAISRRIRDLEDEVGVALFIRHSGGVRMTYAGQQFVGQARKGIDQIGRAAQDAGTIGRGEQGLVRIGIFSSIGSGFLADLIQAYEGNHPGVRLEFVEGGPFDHVPAIQRHRLDIAFLAWMPDVDGCDTFHLWNARIYVAMATRHDLAAHDQIEWDNLRGQEFVVSEAPPGPEVYDYLVKHLGGLGQGPCIERQAVHRDTLMQIVAGGTKLTLTSEATVATRFPGVVFRPLAEESLPFHAVWSPRNDNPAFRRLLSLAKRMSTRSGGGLRAVADVTSQIPGLSR